MDEAPTARRFSLKFLLLAGGLALACGLAYNLFQPPPTAWGSWFMDPTVPRDHKAYCVYGASWLEDLHLRLSGRVIVYIPVRPHPKADTGWPRLTGRHRPVAANQGGEDEIELRKP